jgi:leucyl/phenylalanyl-tRNA---protein transferase
MPILTEELAFPDPNTADEEGLVAIGGDLSVQRLLLAYHNGIFPWYSEPFIGWYSPNPRMVLLPGELKVSSSMRTVLNNGKFRFSINKAFRQVINNCKTASRKDQPGSWISDDIADAYTKLHEAGYAYSAEAWQGNELVGGLYGVRIGKMFFGESMFSNAANASKFAFIKYVLYLQKQGVELIDCQVYTQHLETLGAREIDRNSFLSLLRQYTKVP